MGAVLPEGTVTFLFSDVEGSTSLVNALGDAAFADVLAAHHAVIREAIGAHGGVEVSTAGDGFFVAFASPAGSIGAAVDAQLALANLMWPHGVAVRVRMGIHTGEALLASTGYVGLTVHEAARIASAGHGGQVLVSSRTAAIVSGVLPQAVSFRSLGRHRLKDLTEAQEIHQLCHPKLPDDFAPLKSLNERLNNLPAQLTSFVGRAGQVDEVAEIVRGHRLVTLVGAGGSGKTRLALQVAAEMTDEFADGVWFVELAPVSDPSFVAGAIATALGMVVTTQDPKTAVVEFLRDRRLLLVVDNCEHLVDASAHAAVAITRDAPQVHLLLTSRESLAIAGETVWRVPSLEITPAVSLFCDRARQARADFAPMAEDLAAIETVCARLDGMPLAIELAAARARVLTPADIAARLDDRFRLLTGGSRAALARQQTLQATVVWSYDLLDDVERAALARLAAFSGGFTLAAAEAVIADDVVDALACLDIVASLHDKSLLTADVNADGRRYGMLETIRHFSRGKLIERGEIEDLRRAHVAWVRTLAEAAGPGLVGPDQGAWLDRVEADKENVFAALEWAAEDPPSLGDGYAIAGALGEFFLRRAYMSEATTLYDALLARADGLDDAVVIPVLHGRGKFSGHVTGFEQEHFVWLLKLAERSGDAASAALARFWIAWRAAGRAEAESDPQAFAQSRRAARAAIAEMRGVCDPTWLANALVHAGRLEASDDEADEVALRVADATEGLAIATRVGDTWNIGAAHISLATLARESGDLEGVRPHLEACLELSRRLDFAVGVYHGLAGLAEMAAAEGDAATIRQLLPELREVAARIGNRSSFGYVLLRAGLPLRVYDEAALAGELFEEGLQTVRAPGADQGTLLTALFLVAEQHRVAGRFDEFDAIVEEMSSLGPMAGAAHVEPLVCILRGAGAVARGDAEGACRELAAALRTAADDDDRANALRWLVRAGEALGEFEDAARWLGCAAHYPVEFPPVYADAVAFDQTVARLREVLGDDAFEAASAAGAAMTADDVIAELARPNA